MLVDSVRGAKISILLPNLQPGGAERVCIYLANAFVARGHQVDMVLMRAQGELMPLLDARVRVVDLHAPRVRNLYGPLRRYLLQTQPAAVLANMWPLTVMAVGVTRLSRLHTRVAVVEHSNWSASIHIHNLLHRIALRLSMRALMPLADVRVGVSGGVARDLENVAGLREGSVCTVFNPVTGIHSKHDVLPVTHGMAHEWMCSPHKRIIAIGTLKSEKRFDYLLRAFALLAQRDARLLILGEGGERQSLEALADSLGVSERVSMPGFTRDPSQFLRIADLFVLTSDYEGLPTVLIEALEQGTPVVSTDCPSGPREILEEGKHGTLVPVGDVDALARAMEDALTRDHDREALKRRAEDFSVDKAADAYLGLLLPGWRDSPQ